MENSLKFFSLQMEDDLNILVNGRRLQINNAT
jgi:hypothetical protein